MLTYEVEQRYQNIEEVIADLQELEA